MSRKFNKGHGKYKQMVNDEYILLEINMDNNIIFKLNNVIIEKVNSIKCFGFIIDKKMFTIAKDWKYVFKQNIKIFKNIEPWSLRTFRFCIPQHINASETKKNRRCSYLKAMERHKLYKKFN